MITFPEERNYEPQVKPPWWNDNHFCDFHRNKGHHIDNCQRLKHVIQDLIDNGVIKVDGHTTNESHITLRLHFQSMRKVNHQQKIMVRVK